MMFGKRPRHVAAHTYTFAIADRLMCVASVHSRAAHPPCIGQTSFFGEFWNSLSLLRTIIVALLRSDLLGTWCECLLFVVVVGVACFDALLFVGPLIGRLLGVLLAGLCH